MGRLNNVKVEAREAAHRYRTVLQQMGRGYVSVTVRGSHVIIDGSRCTAEIVNEMAAMLEGRLRRDEELTRTFGGQP